MRITYNSPVILSYGLLCSAILVGDMFLGGLLTAHFFSAPAGFSFFSPPGMLRLVTHIFGHAGWEHLVGNFTLILLIGPLLEERYGSYSLLLMILITASVTGALNGLFFSTGIMGASGVAFMLIILSSFTNMKKRELPLTFVAVILLFVVKEVAGAIKEDNISQFAHILGGTMGSLFGFCLGRNKTMERS